jgi:hypothetical protein
MVAPQVARSSVVGGARHHQLDFVSAPLTSSAGRRVSRHGAVATYNQTAMGAAIRWGMVRLSGLFDALQHRWEGPRMQRAVGGLLVATFLAMLAVIELGRRGVFPAGLSRQLPTNHFFAVDIAFTLLLLFEAVALVFSLAESVAKSVGKQFEIYSLILVRYAFKGFTSFHEPLDWAEVRHALPHMLVDAAGALAIFVLLGLFYRLQRHQAITPDAQEVASFVVSKKIVALVLLASFAAVGVVDVAKFVRGEPTIDFFEAVYTMLIFSDVLLVLLSLRYSSTYPVVFRNSGFAAATVLMRLALTAPPFVNAGVGVAACLLALGITAAYNAFRAWVHAERA